ncbi:energy-coupling factor transport system permease protein [Desulfitobacterium sp. LBE]|nr:MULTISPECIES: energy-coupling factor transporter transmembrane component T [Desulfitobacterium]TWH57406.1 energy-coupling factor transport system permease protein [Desulfitobacterium sp. LBE]
MARVKIGRYVPGDSPIHRLDPRTKLVGGFVIILAILIDDGWQVMALGTLLMIVAISLSQIGWPSVLRSLKWLWLVFFLSFAVQVIATDGRPILSVGPLTLTWEGVYRGVVTFLRLLIIYLNSTLLTMTTSPMRMAGGLEALFAPLRHVGLPVSQFAMMTSISLRFVPTILEEGEMIIRAQKSRGAPFHSTNKLLRIKTGLAVLVPLIIGALQRATDLAAAMESRCYSGGSSFNRAKELRFQRIDGQAALFILFFCVLPLTLFWGR